MGAVYSSGFSPSLASSVIRGGLRVEVLKDMEADNRITPVMAQALLGTLVFTILNRRSLHWRPVQ
jgi:phosphopantothenoylcysteine synthetase/decarboxylase